MLRETAKAYLAPLLGDQFEVVRGIAYALMPLAAPWSRLYWPFLVSFIVIAYVAYRNRDDHADRVRFISYLLPRAIYLHPDAVRTYCFVALNGIVGVFVDLGAIVVASVQVAEWTRAGLEATFGEIGRGHANAWTAVGYSLLVLVVRDLAAWTSHALFHRVPGLWEIHKVHHCPCVLTPITDKQFHPLELVARGIVAACLVGPVIGVANYAYFAAPQEIKVLEVAAFMIGFNIFANLRHSHIWIGFPRWLSHIVSSPAMHQTHHSMAEKHCNKNYAVLLSLWDWVFGTLYIPRERERLELGVSGDPASEYDSLLKLYVRPVVKSLRTMRPR